MRKYFLFLLTLFVAVFFFNSGYAHAEGGKKLEIVYFETHIGMAIFTPNGNTYIVDPDFSDSEYNKIRDYLKSKGIRNLGIIITHPHCDHFGGCTSGKPTTVEKFAQDFKIEKLIDTGFHPLKINYKTYKEGVLGVVENEGGVIITGLRSGDILNLDPDLTVKVLSPRSKSEDARNGDGFWEKSELQEKDREVTEARYWNENSLAFLISYGDFDALFTGDIPKYTSQPYIISRYKDLLVKTEIVGIPHHGKNGNYFNSEFAKTIGKDAAVVIGIATRDYEDVILNGYKNNNNKIIILDGKNNGRITVSIEGGSNQFTVCQSVGNICKTYSLTSSLTSGGASLSESLSESVEKCGESAYFGPNGIFQKAYISYRGKQYDTSTPFLGIYHGEGFEFVIEAKVDTDDKKKCMILLHPSSYALGYIEANGASDKQTFIKFSEDTEGSTITYRIPYRFDLYDNSGNPLVDNFKGKVNIYLFEIVQFHPEVKTTLHYRIPFATFNINIRKPEIYNFYQSNSVINIYDTNSNNDSFEIKFSFTGLKEGDEYSIYYDVDGDGSFELYDNKKYTFSHTGSSSSQEVFILCNNFTKSGANFVYKCAVDGDEPSTFFIKPSAYSGKLFVVLTDYKIDGNYYLATDHFTVPVTVCDEKSCFFGVFPKSNIEEFINSLSNFVFVLISIGAILMIIIGGFVLLTSGGNYERIQKGKKILTYAILGFVVALFANIIYALIKTIII